MGFDQNLGVQVPPGLRFRDDHGRDVRLQDYFGKRPVILALVYYRCPLLCNQVLNGLTSTLKVLSTNAGSGFDIVAVSIDPEESASLAGQKKAAYLERYDRPGTEAGWHFLVGDPEPIQALSKTVGFRYTYNPTTKLYAHAAGIIVLTPDGRASRYFYGIEYPPKLLAEELKRAGSGRIGSPIGRLLLLCYDYDAATGKYTLAIVRIIRVLGSATAISLAAYMLFMFRRDQTRRGAEAGNGQPGARNPLADTGRSS